jgi:hypothetical protein
VSSLASNGVGLIVSSPNCIQWTYGRDGVYEFQVNGMHLMGISNATLPDLTISQNSGIVVSLGFIGCGIALMCYICKWGYNYYFYGDTSDELGAQPESYLSRADGEEEPLMLGPLSREGGSREVKSVTTALTGCHNPRPEFDPDDFRELTPRRGLPKISTVEPDHVKTKQRVSHIREPTKGSSGIGENLLPPLDLRAGINNF